MARATTPDVFAPPPHHRRFPLLDGMRAVAVLCVVVVHVAFFAAPGTVPAAKLLLHLNVGVTIFFLISGFLLYRPFIAHRAGGAAAPPIGQYAKRRALRILPAYWLVLTVLTVLPGTTGVSGGEWLSQYALLQTLPFTDNSQSCADVILTCGLAQTWSLVVELTFYAVLPLWFLFSERLARGRAVREWVSIELIGLGILSIVSVLLAFGSDSSNLTSSLVGGTVAGFVFWFAIGMTLAITSVAVESRRSRPRAVAFVADHPGWIWITALVAYAALSAWLPASAFLFERNQVLVTHLAFGLIALLLMLPAVFADDAGGAPRRFLAHPFVAWIGLVSYGVFLWHYVVTVELGNTPEQSDFWPIGSGNVPLGFWPLLGATLAISLTVAAASYYLLERPLLRFKYRRTDDGSDPRAPATAASILPRP